ncbi:MAG: hypothetical protein ACRD0W_00875 [Acidimicrobiales bacterium]
MSDPNRPSDTQVWIGLLVAAVVVLLLSLSSGDEAPPPRNDVPTCNDYGEGFC